jgi:hypothetical protein
VYDIINQSINQSLDKVLNLSIVAAADPRPQLLPPLKRVLAMVLIITGARKRLADACVQTGS